MSEGVEHILAPLSLLLPGPRECYNLGCRKALSTHELILHRLF